MQTPSPRLFKFGSFDLDGLAGELRQSDSVIKLQPQPFKVLLLLVSRAGQVVTRDEFRHEVWGDDTFVDFEHGLNFCINQVREALQDSAVHPQFIETVPRRGYRFVAPVETLALAAPLVTSSGTPITTPVALRWLWRAVLLAVAGLIGTAFFLHTRSAALPPAGPIRSIAVLPLVNMSRDSNQDYFADGMTEALITNLSKLQELKVISRTSIMQYKASNKPLPQIARELGVDGIVEGSVVHSGSRVRITAQLIRGTTDTHLWADSFDRDARDVLSLQTDVARAITEQIRVATTPAEQQRMSPGQAVNAEAHPNVEAYNAYLKGKYFYWRSNNANLLKAIAYYEQASKLDPDYALAWVGLAEAYVRQADAGYVPAEEGYNRGRAAAQRALALDPNLAEAYMAIGYIKTAYDWDWVGADASYRRALALQPGNAAVIGSAALLAGTVGRLAEATALVRRSLELNPLHAPSHLAVGFDAFSNGRPGEAVAPTRKALELDPNLPFAHVLLGFVSLEQGRPQEGLAEIERESERPLRLYGEAVAYHALGNKKRSDLALAAFIADYQSVDAFQIAEVYAYRGESNEAFAWLDRAYAQHDSGMTLLLADPLLKNILRDSRYAALLEKMRLPA